MTGKATRGNTVEYGAHVIPEGGPAGMPKLVGDGILVVGDAAGLALNLGITVRGMDLALVSGVLAARAILKARESGDYSAAGLSSYQTSLDDSFVGKDMRTFKDSSRALDNPRLFTQYPAAICRLFEQLMWFGDEPKERLSRTALRQGWRAFGNLATIKDAVGLLKL